MSLSDRLSWRKITSSPNAVCPENWCRYAEENQVALTLESVEKNHILKMLHFFDDNRQKTAEIFGISRKTLYRKLEDYARN